MSHEVENMLFVGETPWHGLGKRFVTAPSLDEAIVAAGLDWNVAKKPLVIQGTDTVAPAVAAVRESDNSILGVVGPDYHILQNKDAFKFFQPFIDSKAATLETAGSLKQGKRVFILAKTQNTGEIVQGDAVESYILLSNSHDGTMAIRVGFTPIRVVCANTLRAAHGDSASKLIRIRHTSNMQDTLDMIGKVMDTAKNEFNASLEQYRFLASKQLNMSDLSRFVKIVLGVSEHDATNTDKGNRVLAEVIPLFENGRGANIAGVRGSYWGAYNAFNEYLGYVKGRSADNRVDSLWFGQSAALNQKALDTALAMAKAA